MKTLARFIILLLGNVIGFYIASHYVDGLTLQQTLQAYIKVAGVFTIAYILIRPLIKILLTPIIIITLGLGSLIINALLLWGLDSFVQELSISGLYPLVYATLIISVINFACMFAINTLARQNSD